MLQVDHIVRKVSTQVPQSHVLVFYVRFDADEAKKAVAGFLARNADSMTDVVIIMRYKERDVAAATSVRDYMSGYEVQMRIKDNYHYIELEEADPLPYLHTYDSFFKNTVGLSTNLTDYFFDRSGDIMKSTNATEDESEEQLLMPKQKIAA